MLAPFPRFWTTLIVGIAAIVVLIVGARLAAGSAAWAQTELPLDQFLSRAHLPVLDVVALSIQWLLSPVVGLVIVLLASAVVLAKTRDWPVSLTFALVVSGGWLSSEIVKIIVHRARPDYNLLAHPLSTEVSFDSFPSGHTSLATALAVGIVLLLRGQALQTRMAIFGGVGVLIVAWSRLYVGAHYPLDVLGSILYTAAVMIVFLAVWNRWVVNPRGRANTPRAPRDRR